MKKLLLLSITCFSFATIQAQNVGIGTATPVYKLDVAGRLRLQHAAGTAGIYFDGVTLPTRSFVGTFDDDHFGIFGSVAGWNVFMNVNNGNFGIGEQAPAHKLDLRGRMRIQHTPGTSAGIVLDGSTTPIRSFIGTMNDDYVGMYGYGGASWNFVMNVNNGNIGIGTPSPQYPLSFKNSLGPKISFWDNGSTNFGISLQSSLLQIHTGASTNDIVFGYGSSASLTELMRIKGTGNVSIGTENPLAKLHVAGNSVTGYQNMKIEETDADHARMGYINSGTTKFWETTAISSDIDANSNFNIFNSTWGNLLTVRGDGNVGINNANPDYPLSFANSTGEKIAFWKVSPTAVCGIGLQDFKLQIHGSTIQDNIVFGYGASTSLTELMRIQGNGNVGIGTMTPTTKLEVNGYTKLGSEAPAIKMKKITGTIGNTTDPVILPHGILSSKIIAVTAMVEYGSGSYVHESYTIATQYEFNYHITSTNIVISPKPGNSNNLLNKNFKMLITYEE